MIDVAREFERMRAYLVGQLPDDEVRDFEDRLVRDPELVREFEQSLRLHAGMQELRAQGYFARRSSVVRRLRLQLPALAAAVIAGIAILLWMQTRTAGTPLLSTSPVARGAADERQIRQLRLIAMRGEQPIPALPAGGVIELQVAPPMRAPDGKYRLTLLPAGAAQPIGILDGVAPRADGFLYGYADAARLAAGGYVLSVEPQHGAPGHAHTFPFNLRAGAATSP